MWNRRSRTVALLVGVVVAATAFGVLTGATRSQQLVVKGTLASHFRASYDILVRPAGSRTRLERSEGLIRPNAISGISGGISIAQWRRVLHTPGVAVAAPIAVVGYALPSVNYPIDLTRLLGHATRALFRVSVERVTDNGLTRQTDAPVYVYVTRRPMVAAPNSFMPTDPLQFAPAEKLPGGGRQPVCAETEAPTGPYDPEVRYIPAGGLGDVECWSLASGGLQVPGSRSFAPFSRGHFGALIPLEAPEVIAAVDPAQEAKLAHLPQAMVSGRYLSEHQRPTHPVKGYPYDSVPVLASRNAYTDEVVDATVERLPAAAAARMVHGRPLLGHQLSSFLSGQHGTAVRRVHVGSQAAQRQVLAALGSHNGDVQPEVDAYWTVGPTTYQAGGGKTLVPKRAQNSSQIWLAGATGGFVQAPLDARDDQFRRVTEHQNQSLIENNSLPALLHSVGVFDAAKLPGFTRAAGDIYALSTPGLAPADRASRRALKGMRLLPNANLGGYETQPPLLLTDLASLPAFGGAHYTPNSERRPISAIMVRVAGAVTDSPVSRERLQVIAGHIEEETGLDVDLTAGSSAAPRTIALPAGRFGRPPLRLTEDWVKKGVAVAILDAVSRQSEALLVLILVVCTLFVANATAAAVRGRRRELGVLAGLGWTAPRIFGAVMGEVALIGLTGGVIAAGAAYGLAHAAGVATSGARSALAIPAAVILAVIAGLIPARGAAKVTPAQSIRDVARDPRRSRPTRSLHRLALVNLTRVPGRSALGAASLAVGVCGLTFLLATTIAFHDLLVGSLLGQAVSVQATSSEYVADACIIALGVGGAADVVFLNLRDRASELALLRSLGWDEYLLRRLVTYEGALLGLIGSLLGGIVGLVAAAIFAGALPAGLVATTAIAVAAGALLAAAAAIAVASSLRTLPTGELLAAE
jgi:hypothetical protein